MITEICQLLCLSIFVFKIPSITSLITEYCIIVSERFSMEEESRLQESLNCVQNELNKIKETIPQVSVFALTSCHNCDQC